MRHYFWCIMCGIILMLPSMSFAFPVPSIGYDAINSVRQAKQNNVAKENLNFHKCNDLNYSIQNNSALAESLMKRLENFNSLESVRFVNNFSEKYHSYVNKLNELNSKLELEKTTLNSILPDVDKEFKSLKLSEKSCAAVSNYYFELHLKPFIKKHGEHRFGTKGYREERVVIWDTYEDKPTKKQVLYDAALDDYIERHPFQFDSNDSFICKAEHIQHDITKTQNQISNLKKDNYFSIDQVDNSLSVALKSDADNIKLYKDKFNTALNRLSEANSIKCVVDAEDTRRVIRLESFIKSFDSKWDNFYKGNSIKSYININTLNEPHRESEDIFRTLWSED